MNTDVRLRDAGGGLRTRVGYFSPGSLGLSDPKVGMIIAGVRLYDGPNYNHYWLSEITTREEADEPEATVEQEVELIPKKGDDGAYFFRLVL